MQLLSFIIIIIIIIMWVSQYTIFISVKFVTIVSSEKVSQKLRRKKKWN